MTKRLLIRKGYRIDHVDAYSPDVFEGTYKNYRIYIEREPKEDINDFHIYVTNLGSGYCCYDTTWISNSLQPSMREAVEQALVVNGLIPQKG
jgi:hypothetical protein